MKLLLVEDNLILAADLQRFLQENRFVVEHAATLAAASEKLGVYEYDVAIIDIGLPDGNGLDLISEIKQQQLRTAILILTARDALEDKVAGLELGADDYLTKPFHLAELNARIRSIVRRDHFNRSNLIKAGELYIDTLASEAYVGKTKLILTRKEYDLLLYLMVNQNRLLTRESIAEHLWGDHIDDADSFDFLYNHIKNLRKKIVQAGGRNPIRAMYGMGYKFLGDE
ncbi:MAG TPA: response regulator transcription factor [bacterium]|jgi:DNA-binding response OmpR family regulator|nr:response regulator transcription factor [bacterium]HOX85060.1 response regulator transcription factor [bacterium]HPG44074.1 response regulator transcription factor [bacterium]HPM96440.1 response regulator transcription factor [bacterium]